VLSQRDREQEKQQTVARLSLAVNLTDHLVDTTIKKSKAFHSHHSAVAALSLRARPALMKEDAHAAVPYSTEAVEYLRNRRSSGRTSVRHT
jgi:hypothetical protein